MLFDDVFPTLTRPLHQAVELGDISELQTLLDAGEDVDDRDPNFTNMTPLMVAAIYGRREMTEVLLQRGANMSLVDDFNMCPAASFALSYDEPEVLEMLLAHWGDVDTVVFGDDVTLIMQAVTSNRVACVRVLLQHGASMAGRVSRFSDFSVTQTLAEYAEEQGFEELLDLLLEEEVRRGEF